MEQCNTPEKRLSLEQWQYKIASSVIISDYADDLRVRLTALQQFHKQEVSSLQSQIPQYFAWIRQEQYSGRLYIDADMSWVHIGEEGEQVSDSKLYEIYQDSLPPTN